LVTASALEQLSAFLVPAHKLETKRGHVPTPWPTLNDLLGGGWQLGALNEVHGPRSSGRTSVLYASLAAALQRGAVAALVDTESAFDPRRAEQAGIPLRQLLWVCAQPSQTFKAAEMIVSAGGFELVGLDLGDYPPRLPTAGWIRLRNVAEKQGTAVLLTARFPLAGTCSAMSLQLRQNSVDFGFDARLEQFRPPLVTGISSSACVSRGRHGPMHVVECALFFRQPGSSLPLVAQLAAQRTPA
jgi:recA bacterial DNA recombination protein